MTDTANPEKLASVDSFDARLKALDEPRWLASRYATDDARRRLVAVWLLRAELHRALTASEPMLGKIRLQWWRESLDSAAGPTPRRHDLTEELAAVLKDQPALLAPMQEVVDRHDDILDDHMAAGGHIPGGDHEQRHIEAEAASWRLAGASLMPAAPADQLAILAGLAAAEVSIRAGLPNAADLWLASAKAARTLKPDLWPAAAHILAVAPTRPEPGPLGLRLAIFWSVLTRRL